VRAIIAANKWRSNGSDDSGCMVGKPYLAGLCKGSPLHAKYRVDSISKRKAQSDDLTI